jgi:hypothetical protein
VSSACKFFLHELTQAGIKSYVQDTLQRDPRFRRLHLESPEDSDDLASAVRNKAQGVFLWVFLVVRSLLRGLTSHDGISDLKLRLEELPPDLAAYFRHIFDSIETVYRQQTAQIFLFLLHADHPLTILIFHFLESIHTDPDYAISCSAQTFQSCDRRAMFERQKRRLNSRCSDLAEIEENNLRDTLQLTVRFLHRTVFDFLHTKDMYAQLVQWAGPSFHPIEHYSMHVYCDKRGTRLGNTGPHRGTDGPCLRGQSAAGQTQLVQVLFDHTD